MTRIGKPLLTLLAAFMTINAFVSGTPAQELQTVSQAIAPIKLQRTPVFYNWMSTDVALAWRNQYFGQGTTITVVDDFSSASKFAGRLTSVTQTLRHGQWTSLEAGLVAPGATIRTKDFYGSNTAVSLAPGLNILNLSYGMYAAKGYSSIRWGAEEASIISYARNGQAIIAKAAGNDAIAVGGVTSAGNQDYLNIALTGTPTTIFAGALNKNGTITDKASLASYSNRAGSDARVQSHFLVVGVTGNQTGLYGTSFAAPVISAYAAVIGSKFTTATPTQITNQLLNTARTNTLVNYNAATYGRGEACLSCALAPISIK